MLRSSVLTNRQEHLMSTTRVLVLVVVILGSSKVPYVTGSKEGTTG